MGNDFQFLNDNITVMRDLISNELAALNCKGISNSIFPIFSVATKTDSKQGQIANM